MCRKLKNIGFSKCFIKTFSKLSANFFRHKYFIREFNKNDPLIANPRIIPSSICFKGIYIYNFKNCLALPKLTTLSKYLFAVGYT